MNDAQRMVSEFHRVFDVVIGTSPAIPDEATCALRVSLMQEELDELRAALAQRDVEAVAKELADLLYVVYGTAVSCGLDMDPVFREVHRSNMSKVGGHKRADGKWIKPPGYSPARLQPILAAQGVREYQDAGVQTPHSTSDLAVSATTAPVSPSGPGLVRVSPDEHTTPPPASGGSLRGVARVQPTSTSESRQRVRQARQSDTRMRQHDVLHCPRCGKNFVRRSHRKNSTERLLSLVYIYPFRCQVCGHRFKTFRFGVRYTQQPIDRRQYERLPTHVPTTFAESVKPGEHRVGTGVVTDISLGGCYMQTVVRLLEGSLLSLELQTAENAQAITVEAAIVRSVRPTGVGMEFLRLHESEHERLSQFVRQLLTERHTTEHEAKRT